MRSCTLRASREEDLGTLSGGTRWEQAIITAFLFTIAALPAYAQLDRAQIAGLVKDQQGRVLPAATVTATNQATRLANTTVTNETGYYVFRTWRQACTRSRRSCRASRNT